MCGSDEESEKRPSQVRGAAAAAAELAAQLGCPRRRGTEVQKAHFLGFLEHAVGAHATSAERASDLPRFRTTVCPALGTSEANVTNCVTKPLKDVQLMSTHLQNVLHESAACSYPQ